MITTDMYKKGQIIKFETGSYPNRRVIGLFKVLKGFNLTKTLLGLGLPLNTIENSDRKDVFYLGNYVLSPSPLVIAGYIKEIGVPVF